MHSLDRYFAERRHPEWGWFHVAGVNVCVPKKNGSTSFRFSLLPNKPMAEFLKSYRPMSNDEVRRSTCKRYLAVRDPVDRFASLWKTVQVSRDFRSLCGVQPERFLELIAGRLHEDAHWQPQSDYWIEGTELVPYDRMLSVLGLNAVWATRSVIEAPPMPEDMVREVYAQDVALLS